MSWVGCPGLKEARGPLLKLMDQDLGCCRMRKN